MSNTTPTTTTTPATKSEAMNSTAIKEAILAELKTRSRIISLFGQNVEVRQPSLEAFQHIQKLAVPDETNPDMVESAGREQMFWMIIRCTFAPGTQDRIFQDSDYESIKNMPFGKDVMDLVNAITELTSLSNQVEKEGNA